MNIFLTQFRTEKLLIHKPQPRLIEFLLIRKVIELGKLQVGYWHVCTKYKSRIDNQPARFNSGIKQPGPL